MSSKKALKRSKGILLAIDLILLAVAIVGGIYCGNWIIKIESLKHNDYEARLAHIAYEEAKIDDELKDALPEIEAMEAQCAQQLNEAKAEREAALRKEASPPADLSQTACPSLRRRQCQYRPPGLHRGRSPHNP